MLELRPFQDEPSEYEFAAQVQNLGHIEFLTTAEEMMEEDDLREPEFVFERFIATTAGQDIGVVKFGEVSFSPAPGKFFFEVFLRPEFEAEAWMDAALASVSHLIRLHKVKRLVAFTNTQRTAYVDWLAKRGFAMKLTEPISKLDLGTFDPTPYSQAIESALSEGFEFTSAAELERRGVEWVFPYYKVGADSLADIPFYESLRPRPFEVFAREILNEKRFNREGLTVAVKDGEVVGRSDLIPSRTGAPRMFTGLTAVKREHRRKGLATGMKVRAAIWARDAGIRWLLTDNAETNPMLQLNVQLGFRSDCAWIHLEKPINSG